jgi:hypothetical protein
MIWEQRFPLQRLRSASFEQRSLPVKSAGGDVEVKGPNWQGDLALCAFGEGSGYTFKVPARSGASQHAEV